MTGVKSEMKSNDKNKMNKNSKQIVCEGCGKVFESKNALFRHLRCSAAKTVDRNGNTVTSSCLSPDDYRDFMKYVVNRDENLDKIAVLYGYIPCDDQLQRKLMNDVGIDGEEKDGEKIGVYNGIKDGEHAAQLLLEAIHHVNLVGGSDVLLGADDVQSHREHEHESMSNQKKAKISRSNGCTARGTDIVAQDEGTGAVTEILCARAPQMIVHADGEESKLTDEEIIIAEDKAMQIWVDNVNIVLRSKIMSRFQSKDHNGLSCSPGRIQVFARITVPKKFNAELDATHRRVDYIMPADFIFTDTSQQIYDDTNDLPGITFNDELKYQSRDEFFRSLGAFKPSNQHNPPSTKKFEQSALKYLFKLKKLMQRFCTKIVEIDEKDDDAKLAKEFNTKKRRKQRKGSAIQRDQLKQQQRQVQDQQQEQQRQQGQKQGHDHEQGKSGVVDNDNESGTGKKTNNKSKSKANTNTNARVLKRRCFHNFTPKVMAHEFLAFRRLDRFYHRATVRTSDMSDVHNDNPQEHTPSSSSMANHRDDGRPFVVFSLTGDLFLNGQARAIIGLFVAIVRGYIHEDILDCIFDGDYADLVPAPPLPAAGLYAGETSYMTWEGKMKATLTPRKNSVYGIKGFHTKRIRDDVFNFEKEVQRTIMRAWNILGTTTTADQYNGTDTNNLRYGRMATESHWMTHHLKPWAKKVSIQLQQYRAWKAARDLSILSNHKVKVSDTLLPPLQSVTSDVPHIFQNVLSRLREANSSGLWPSTTPKRQLVMRSTNNVDAATSDTNRLDTARSLTTTSLLAEIQANKQTNNTATRTSAYVYQEGEGGASGSFSVGAMPGKGCEQPKGNTLFPELMKAAFELEMILCPDRPPSSTIAINRNAQFRPHVDNGAGAGQSTSLIVGLGTYVGGQLVVEGQRNDIRYKSIQFNGWTQRHWTLPFRGERFSLVWFTPKGCEGVRGIDLCT